MGREIKFRAWDEYQKCWIPRPRFDACNNSTGVILEQFTGLYDMNGKEIYEGDIVGDDTQDEKIEVSYSEEKAAFVFNVYGISSYTGEGGFNEDGGWDLIEIVLADNYNDFSTWAVIIGNIHENPELLK